VPNAWSAATDVARELGRLPSRDITERYKAMFRPQELRHVNCAREAKLRLMGAPEKECR